MLAERLRRLPHMVNFSLQYRTAALRAERRLAQLARGQGPIIAGPFRSEIGFEVLYWIPLLRWFVERYDIEPDRVLAVSRGGPASWYRDVAGAYADVFDHYTPGDLRRWLDEQVAATGSQKQKALSAPEREVLARIARERGLEGAAILHPSVMYNLFWAYNAGYRPIEDVAARTRFRRLPDPGRATVDLPEDYIAVKIYFSTCFPETEANRAFAADLIARLAATRDVVLLSTNLAVDDHRDYQGAADGRIHAIDHLVTPRDNLDVQTRVIAGARGLVTTYGGFAYLGPFLGVPSCSFYANDEFMPAHLALMRHATAVLRAAGEPVAFSALATGELPLIDELLRAPTAAPR